MPLTAAEQDLLKRSTMFRRQTAWSVVARVVAEVQPTPADHATEITIPRWMTWYGKDDLERIFTKAFTSLSPASRRARAPIPEDQVRAAEVWVAEQLQYLPQWTPERRSRLLASLSDHEAWRGATGLNRTLFAPATTSHLVTSYQKISECDQNADGHSEACLQAKFPADAVAVKTQWTRRGSTFPVAVFDTNSNSLRERLGDHGRSWDFPDRFLPDIAGRSLALKLAPTAQFDLTGLHIMTKESEDWLWISLWWSEKPDEDFGADRPEALAHGPWSNYKMCVTGSFEESPEDDSDLLASFPSLGSAILASRGTSGLSWCSNPYLEKGTGNQKTNCIGCHQHAGTSIEQTDILGSTNHGRGRILRDFPADYLWSLNFGTEKISHMLSERVRYHSGN
jgi:hypothetical protein